MRPYLVRRVPIKSQHNSPNKTFCQSVHWLSGILSACCVSRSSLGPASWHALKLKSEIITCDTLGEWGRALRLSGPTTTWTANLKAQTRSERGPVAGSERASDTLRQDSPPTSPCRSHFGRRGCHNLSHAF